MLVDVSVDGGPRFPAHVELIREEVLLPLTRCSLDSQKILVLPAGLPGRALPAVGRSRTGRHGVRPIPGSSSTSRWSQ